MKHAMQFSFVVVNFLKLSPLIGWCLKLLKCACHWKINGGAFKQFLHREPIPLRLKQ